DFGPEQARQAHDLLPAWSETDSQLAQVFTFLGKAQKRPDFLARGRAWRQAAAARDPSDARLWNDLAGAELDAQLLDLADTHYRRALLDDPWSVRAMNGLAQVALARRKPDDAIRFWTRSLRAAPNQRGIKRELQEIEELHEKDRAAKQR